jgi:hypothetical protein
VVLGYSQALVMNAEFLRFAEFRACWVTELGTISQEELKAMRTSVPEDPFAGP